MAFGLLSGVLTLLSLRGSPARRAALSATAASVVWALEATFIKSTSDTLTSYGLTGTLTRWPVYALVVGGILGSLLVQAALHVGPLAVSQPLMVAVDPFVSVILGIWLFGEHFNDEPANVAVGCLAFVLMAAGVVLDLANLASGLLARPRRARRAARLRANPFWGLQSPAPIS